MRRTGIALAAVLYIYAATIKVVSASEVEEKPHHELKEFAKPVDTSYVGAAERPKDANNTQKQNRDVIISIGNGYQHTENGVVIPVVRFAVVGFKGDGDSLKKSAAVSSLVALASNGPSNQQEMQNIAQRIGPFFAKPLEGSFVQVQWEVEGELSEATDMLDNKGVVDVLSEPTYMLDNKGVFDGLLEIGKQFNTRFNLFTNVVSADFDPFIITSRAWLYPQTGFGVISDIEDTIKVTGTLSAQEAKKNTFIKEYTPEDGMDELFFFLKRNLTLTTNIGDHTPTFTYLDNGVVRQLSRPIQTFLEAHYPEGEFIPGDFMEYDTYIKQLRWPFEPEHDAYKLEGVRYVLERFPNRKFLLIGDSSQRDPEVYGQAYREFPGQITCILIRKVTGFDSKREAILNQDKRFVDAFKNIPSKHWDLFDKGSDLTDKVDYQKACRR